MNNLLGGWRCRWRRILTGGLALAGLALAAAEKKEPVAPTPDQNAMLAHVFPSIVRIEAIRLNPMDGRMTKQWSAGSGAIISEQGHVITNCHVSEGADYFRCYLFDGTHVDARRVGQDAMTDLAVLQLDLSQRAKEAGPLPVAKFGDSDRLVAGDIVFAVGSPGFLSQSVTRGIVANPSLVMPEQTVGKMLILGEDVGRLVRWILHDASIFHGNSGGPLLNGRGEIVGVNEIGVFNLGGAIPGNLARGIAAQLVAGGRVQRGWTGLTVQPRLEADNALAGVLIADVAPGSPAEKAGLVPGDVLLAGDGHAIEGGEEKSVSNFYRLEAGGLPGAVFVIDYQRAGSRLAARLTLAMREQVQADNVELRGWGAVMRDLTPRLVRDERLPDQKGVWLENTRPAGPCGQAEPELRRQDVLISVDGQVVGNVAELRALTDKLLADAPGGTRSVLAAVRRNGAVVSSVVELRLVNERNVTPLVRKAWLGVASQPLTPKLGTRLGINAGGGARVTRIYPDTQAAAAGLQVGDVLLAIDGMEISARRPEDSDVLARQIRQYKAGTSAVFTLWRDGKKLDLPVLLDPQPTPAAEMAWWEDTRLEFAVRDLAFDDRVRLQLAPGETGVLVENSTLAGWAYLAGLRTDDLVQRAGDTPVATVAELRRARDEAVKAGREWWVLLARRRGESFFIEINLKPAKP